MQRLNTSQQHYLPQPPLLHSPTTSDYSDSYPQGSRHSRAPSESYSNVGEAEGDNPTSTPSKRRELPAPPTRPAYHLPGLVTAYPHGRKPLPVPPTLRPALPQPPRKSFLAASYPPPSLVPPGRDLERSSSITKGKGRANREEMGSREEESAPLPVYADDRDPDEREGLRRDEKGKGRRRSESVLELGAGRVADEADEKMWLELQRIQELESAGQAEVAAAANEEEMKRVLARDSKQAEARMEQEQRERDEAEDMRSQDGHALAGLVGELRLGHRTDSPPPPISPRGAYGSSPAEMFPLGDTKSSTTSTGYVPSSNPSTSRSFDSSPTSARSAAPPPFAGPPSLYPLSDEKTSSSQGYAPSGLGSQSPSTDSPISPIRSSLPNSFTSTIPPQLPAPHAGMSMDTRSGASEVPRSRTAPAPALQPPHSMRVPLPTSSLLDDLFRTQELEGDAVPNYFSSGSSDVSTVLPTQFTSSPPTISPRHSVYDLPPPTPTSPSYRYTPFLPVAPSQSQPQPPPNPYPPPPAAPSLPQPPTQTHPLQLSSLAEATDLSTPLPTALAYPHRSYGRHHSLHPTYNLPSSALKFAPEPEGRSRHGSMLSTASSTTTTVTGGGSTSFYAGGVAFALSNRSNTFESARSIPVPPTAEEKAAAEAAEAQSKEEEEKLAALPPPSTFPNPSYQPPHTAQPPYTQPGPQLIRKPSHVGFAQPPRQPQHPPAGYHYPPAVYGAPAYPAPPHSHHPAPPLAPGQQYYPPPAQYPPHYPNAAYPGYPAPAPAAVQRPPLQHAQTAPSRPIPSAGYASAIAGDGSAKYAGPTANPSSAIQRGATIARPKSGQSVRSTYTTRSVAPSNVPLSVALPPPPPPHPGYASHGAMSPSGLSSHSMSPAHTPDQGSGTEVKGKKKAMKETIGAVSVLWGWT